MAGTRTLLEAQTGRRRRVLVALATADADAGDDVLPRAGALVGGAVVAAGVLLAVLVTSVLGGDPPAGWDDGRLVVARASGARFVSLGGTLYPVPNTTSARLALPSSADGLPVQVVDDTDIARAPRGAALGIAGAPDELPARDRLVPTGWTACLEGGRVTTTVPAGAEGGAPTGVGPRDETALAVRLEDRSGGVELIASGRRHRLPTGQEQLIGRYLGLTAPPVVAPARWAALFPTGTGLDLGAFRFPPGAAIGQALPPGVTVGGRAVAVGQLLSDRDHAGALSVVLSDGTVTLTPFAAAVYRATAPPDLATAQVVDDRALAGTPLSAVSDLVPRDWPVGLPGGDVGGAGRADEAGARAQDDGARPLVSTGATGSLGPTGAATAPTVCARLDASTGRTARTDLVLRIPDADTGTRTGDDPDTVVAPGHGALVRSVSDGQARWVLVDARATASTVVDPSPETLARLGYAGLDPPAVPQAWVALFHRGPDLTLLRPPAPAGAPLR